MENKIAQFETESKKIFGNEYVGFIGNTWQHTGQVAVATTEPDLGEASPAKHITEFSETAKRIFGKHVSVMPFPTGGHLVGGHLIYVVAGLNRNRA